MLLANYFAQSKYETYFALMDAKGHFISSVDPKVTLTDLALKPFNLFHHVRCIVKLARLIRTQKPDFIITGMTASNITVILATLFSGVRTKIIISEHGPTLMWLKNRKNHFVVKWILRVAVMMLYRRANHIVAVSDYLIPDLSKIARISPQRITRIYNPIVHPGLIAKSEKPVDHTWVLEDAPFILAVGRLSTEKNFAFLLRAFAAVIKDNPRLKLVILGDGPERNNLEELIQTLGITDNVSMPGFHRNPYGFMHKARMLALSSNYEGLPTVLVEALACGCPVIATACPGGTAEIAGNGQYGVLVPVGDVEALKTGIADILQHPEEAKKRTLDFHHRQMQEFSLERTARYYMDMVERG